MTHFTLHPIGFGLRSGLLAAICAVLVAGCGGAAKGPTSRSAEQASAAMRDGQQLVERGREAMRRGDSIRAEHYFSLAVEQGYEEGRILPELLSACLVNSRLRSALNYAEPYLRAHPKDGNLRYLVATVHLGLGQTYAAKQELTTLLRHSPDFADAHFLLGMLEFERKEDVAAAHLARYLELRPEGDKANEAHERLELARYEANR